jgi:conserved oligomeric Golgi complex subunit 4
MLTSGLADVTGQAVRERFARLNQMVLLLAMESLVEVAELWADTSIAWRLSAAEVRTVLACRVDLEPSDIASLSLS